MKKTAFLLLSITSFLGHSQQRIKFSYDAAGNQIQRIICLCSAKTENDSIFKDIENLSNEDMIKDSDYEFLSYYPNPVREELYVKWNNKDNYELKSIELFTLSGQLINSINNLDKDNSVAIPFHNFSEGYYNLVFIYSNGERKYLKILKK